MSAKPSSNDFELVVDRQLQLGPASSSSSSRSSYFRLLTLGSHSSSRAEVDLGSSDVSYVARPQLQEAPVARVAGLTSRTSQDPRFCDLSDRCTLESAHEVAQHFTSKCKY